MKFRLDLSWEEIDRLIDLACAETFGLTLQVSDVKAAVAKMRFRIQVRRKEDKTYAREIEFLTHPEGKAGVLYIKRKSPNV